LRIDGSDTSGASPGAVTSRRIDWADSFRNYGLPFAPYGGLNLGSGVESANFASFDPLSRDHPGRDDA